MLLSPVETPADRLARAHYERQQRLAVRASRVAAEAWRSIDPEAIAETWAQRIPFLVQEVRAGQLEAASTADEYVTGAVEAMGANVEASAAVIPTALAGVASDGRPLNTLLAQPAFSALTSIAVGGDVDAALGVGLSSLTRMVATQVVDAGRVADGIAVAARPTVGYVRMLAPPSCSRCAVLAGRHYRWNAGFQRHPRCDCRHIPVAESVRGDVTVDARRYFDSLPKAQQDEIFTAAGAQAIREGADLGQVVNARRGMTAAGTTTEGTTRRGFAGKRLGAGTKTTGRRFGTTTAERARANTRLMPEQIYRDARGDRDLAVRLLREHGFIA